MMYTNKLISLNNPMGCLSDWEVERFHLITVWCFVLVVVMGVWMLASGGQSTASMDFKSLSCKWQEFAEEQLIDWFVDSGGWRVSLSRTKTIPYNKPNPLDGCPRKKLMISLEHCFSKFLAVS